jgi:hypothetical protein
MGRSAARTSRSRSGRGPANRVRHGGSIDSLLALEWIPGILAFERGGGEDVAEASRGQVAVAGAAQAGDADGPGDRALDAGPDRVAGLPPVGVLGDFR